jgi:hypothetical protein
MLAPGTYRAAGLAGWRLPLQNGQESGALFSGALSTNMLISLCQFF